MLYSCIFWNEAHVLLTKELTALETIKKQDSELCILVPVGSALSTRDERTVNSFAKLCKSDNWLFLGTYKGNFYKTRIKQN